MDKKEEIARKRAQLSSAKRELLAKRLKGRGSKSAKKSEKGIEKRPLEETPLLSFAQERLWFLDQLEGKSASYNIPLAVRLVGEVDPVLLEKSIYFLGQRHETLRSNFAKKEDQAELVVHKKPLFSFIQRDFSHFLGEEREKETEKRIEEESLLPFDLEKDPLLRVCLASLKENEHILLLNMHHIISDGWSLGVFVRELGLFYQAHKEEKKAFLPDLPIQYRDFAWWQKNTQKENLEKQLNYWKTQLQGVPPLQLPFDYSDKPLSMEKGIRETITLPLSLSQSLKQIAQKHNTSFFSVLVLAFQILLHRWSGQDDFAIGTPIAGRNRKETEGLIGLFLNVLVLRANLSGNLTFEEALKQTGETLLDAYKNQDVPFERIVQELQPERNLTRPPIFQVMFNLLNMPFETISLPGLTLENFGELVPPSKFDLTLYALEQKNGLRFNLAYNPQLFSSETIQEMLAQWTVLLEQISTHPEKNLDDFSLSTKYSRTILYDPREKIEQPKFPSVFDMVLQWSQRFPNHTAILHQGHKKSYQELILASENLAQVLIDGGVQPGETVAISATRSFGLIVALLAVMRSRGVLLTLDPKLPSFRQQVMIHESKARYAIFLEGCLLPEGISWSKDPWCLAPSSGCLAPNLDDENNENNGCEKNENNERLAPKKNRYLPPIEASDAAYIFFTSGTTGVPKGILGTHQGLSHFINWQGETFDLQVHDQSAQLTGLSFDVVMRDIFLPLTRGATLCLPVHDVLASEDILSWMAEEKITVTHMVPSLAQVWAEEFSSRPEIFSLQKTFFAGEPLRNSLIKKWRKFFPNTEIINLYGPTETTLAKCFYRVPLDSLRVVQPLGRAIPQAQALVLRHSRKLCALQEVGEIFLRTPFRSRGYINASQDDQDRFQINPFTQQEDDLLYRTGDQGRWLTDGNLEILGRVDHQVKIRGVRIELSEIEVILEQHPLVKAQVVIAKETKEGEKTLLAYFVSEPGSSVSNEEIRLYLEQRLPEYMIPSACVPLSHLPLTPNGKIDRKALPTPNVSFSSGSLVEAKTEAQKKLATIWESLLSLTKISVHENFFHLGGHSLRATQLASRIRHTWQINLPLAAVFQFPTIFQLAQEIESYQESSESHEIEIQKRSENIPLSFAQKRLWFLTKLEPNSSSYNIFFTRQLVGKLNVDHLERAFQMIIKRQESFCTQFIEKEEIPYQEIVSDLSWDLPYLDLTGYSELEQKKEIEKTVKKEAGRSFDLRKAPLMRVLLLKCEKERHVLLLNMHHIISDGWSMGILWKELTSIYNALEQGEKTSLSPLSIQYADFSIWQQEKLKGVALQKQQEYWVKQFSGEIPTLDIPTDLPRGKKSNFLGARISIDLGEKLSRALQEFARQESATEFMVLFAAWNILLRRYCGQEDIIIGTPVANRQHKQTENLIGFFVNTLALRTNLTGNPTFLKLLQQVKVNCLEAYQHQDYPFEQLVEVINPPRDTSRHPIFQVMFNLFNMSFETTSLSGVTLEGSDEFVPPSKFDLTLYALEKKSGFRFSLAYNSDLFFPETIQEMLDQWIILLEQIVTCPEKNIADFSLKTKRADNLIYDPTKEIDQPIFPSVFDKVAHWSKEYPDKVAVIDQDNHKSFSELIKAAEMLAQVLVHSGVQPGETVAISATRSFGLVVAILAVMRSRAVLLTLDPKLPSSRQEVMIQEAQARYAIFLEGCSLPELPEGISWAKTPWCLSPKTGCLTSTKPTECLAQNEPNLESLKNGCLAPIDPIETSDLAYVFFTSGTTGVPKGILGTHQGLSHFVHWQGETFSIQMEDRVAQLAGLSFDAMMRDIFLPLTHGATLCLPPHDVLETSDILAWLDREKITLLHVVPSLAQVWAEEFPHRSSISSLRKTFFVGEVLLSSLVQKWQKFFPHSEIINLYGPTETTLIKCFYRIEENGLRAIQPIGRALPQSQVLVLRDQEKLCALQEVGEIFLRTPFRSRGYLNADQRDQARFQVNPFTGKKDDIIYQTGDRGRWLADGNLEFLGRVDHQVKIRGVRVELSGIEALLGEHPEIQGQVVIAWPTKTGEKILVAYFVQKSESDISPEEVLHYLKERLPEYMIPSICMPLSHLPLNANNKIDRKALPDPSFSSTSPVEAQSSVEKELADIWKSLLGLSEIGVHDNFFHLGGHSLRATQLASRIRRTWQIDLPLVEVFQSPTVFQLAQKIESSAVNSLGEEIVIQDRPKNIPLSFAQQRLWFLEQLQPESTLYHIPLAFRGEGPLSEENLTWALEKIVERHESLRTVFGEKEGLPWQKIYPTKKEFLREIWQREELALLLSKNANLSSKELVENWLKREREEVFDLASGPLFRVSLLWISSEKWILSLVFHHLITDGWSLSVFWRELIQIYTEKELGLSKLKDLSCQYADFALWQRGYLQGEVLQRDIDYWRQQLAPPLRPLSLPKDYPPSHCQGYQGAAKSISMSSELLATLEKWSQKEDVTLFMALLASWKVLLFRYTGQKDITIGSTIANRRQEELEGIIGFFVNTLVLRSELSGSLSWQEFVQNVRQTTLDAYRHQDLPFEKLVEELQPERNFGQTPFFRIMFNFQNTPGVMGNLPEIQLEKLSLEHTTAKFDLTLNLSRHERGLSGKIAYNSQFFSPTTIEHLLKHWENLIEALLANPQTSIEKVSFFSEAFLTENFLAEKTAFAKKEIAGEKETYLSLWQKKIPQNTELPAIISQEKNWSYAQLQDKVESYSLFLRQKGVKAGSVVGLALSPQPETIAALLATWKLNATYLPLDPKGPIEKLAFMIKDTSPQILLSEKKWQETLSPLHSSLVFIEDIAQVQKTLDQAEQASFFFPEQIAYIMYTSGSSGQPKGVMVSQKTLLSYLGEMEKIIPPENPIPWLSQITFDACLKQILLPLLRGKSVWVIEEEVRRNPLLLAHNLSKFPSLTLNCVPSLWQVLQDISHKEKISLSLSTLCLGGEDFSPLLVEKTKEQFPAVQIYNFYGPTEATANATYGPVLPQELISIGSSLDNGKIYLLDNHLNPVIPGALGEIFIGGKGISLGYWKRPELTAERFLPDPFSSLPGTRIYRTGDWGRYLPDGQIQYQGRRDQQVKLRGFRIELGEIEAALSSHFSIEEALVATNQSQDKLIAYLKIKDSKRPSLKEIRSFLQSSLVAHMIPDIFTEVDKFPQNRHGKIDRGALSSIPLSSWEEETSEPPQNLLEHSLQKIWQEVLQRESIGRNDNFFLSGGNSLLSVTLIRKIEMSLGKKVPLSAIFLAPTIAQMALFVREKTKDKSVSIPLQRGKNEQALFFLPPVSGQSNCYQKLAQKIETEQAIYALQTPALDDPKLLGQSISEMAKTYLSALFSLQATGPYHLVGWSMGGAIAWEMAQQLQQAGKTVANLILLDTPSKLKEQDSTMPSETIHLLALAENNGIPLTAEELQNIPPAKQIDYLIEKAQNSGMLSPDADLSALRHFFNVYQANSKAVRAYKFKPYIGDVIFLGASEDTNYRLIKEWEKLVQGKLTVELVGGSHNKMILEPTVSRIAKAMNTVLS